MTAAISARRVPRGALVGVAVGAAVLIAALAGGRPGRDGPPLDPRSDGPLGTSALVALLDRLDADVSLSVGLPDGADDVALILRDSLDAEQSQDVAAWVRAGGRLIVTDPGSTFTPGFSPSFLPDDSDLERGTCTIDALADVSTVDAGAAIRYDVSEVDQLCLGDRSGGAFVVARPLGRGEVVAVGGAAFATNELLGEVDNAVLAAALLAPEPGTAVRFVEAPIPAGGGAKTLGDLVPSGVRRGLLQLGIAFAAYALWRAIRLGRPVRELQLVEVDGSELTAAVGRLLARSRSTGAAAEDLREDLRRSLRTRFGVPAAADHATLARVVAARSRIDEATVLAAIDDRPVNGETDLVSLARARAAIHQEVLL